MQLKEFKEKIDKMYNKYGDVDVLIDLILDEEIDDTITTINNNVYTENILDITEATDNKENINGICISNYIMKGNE